MPHYKNQETTTGFGWLLHAAGLGLTVTLVALAYVLFLQPIGVEVQRVARDAQAVASEMEQLPVVIAQRDSLLQMLADREQRHSQILARVPDDVGESEFLAQLTELANSTDIVLSRFHPGLPVDMVEYGSLDIEIELAAPYADVCRFLAGLEDLPRLCRTKALQIIAPEAGSSDCHVVMTLQVFYLTPDSETSDEVTHG